MWLLNVETKKLHYFSDASDVPGGYAILSHTWGDDEVPFDEIENKRAARKEGYTKIHYICSQARKDGYKYAWVDTCCIDKRSSAELSEAINSMFRWYAEAKVCYGYLFDVEKEIHVRGARVTLYDQLRKSRWFTRGWTLQELIAPARVKFYDKQWLKLGDKTTLLRELNGITRIDEDVLKDSRNLGFASVAKRLSWAAERKTSRKEDEAYCLLGIFDVNMPMLYGEGSKAFLRLQEEIVRTSTTVDHSILAWVKPSLDPTLYKTSKKIQLLALSPHWFGRAQGIISWVVPQSEIFEISQRGIRLTAPVKKTNIGSKFSNNVEYAVALNCRHQHKPSTRIVLYLVERPQVEDLNSQGQYQALEQADVSYDRQLHPMISTGDPLPSSHASDVSGSNWKKRTLTIAWEPFLYPRHRNRVHVVLNTCRVSPDSSHPYNLDREQMLPLALAERSDAAPALNGHFKLDIRKQGAASYDDVDTTTIYVEVYQNFNKDTVVESSQPPYLFVGTREMNSGTRWKNQVYNGGTKMLPATGGDLSVSTRYVNLVGEFLWSIKIVPVTSEGDNVSDEEQESGAFNPEQY